MLPLQNGTLRYWKDSVQSSIDIGNRWNIVQCDLTIAVLLLLSIFGGSILRNHATWRDTAGLTALLLVRYWRTTLPVVNSLIQSQSYLYIIVVIFLQASVVSRTCRPPRPNQDHKSQEPAETFLPPLIFPCRTTHTRMFPTKHSFGYSYLYVGIPINGAQRAGTLLSTDLSDRKTWFSVHSEDYLARGLDAEGLRSKLDAYLASLEVSSLTYPYAYLVTAPRFLGFSFNPVSFWYLYDQHQTLAAMILEVNNTFDERRMYFMQNKSHATDPVCDFANDWAKDFHVSPFNDRDGSYSLTAKNPLIHYEDTRIDNNIVLRSEEGKAKIVARVFSSDKAIDPAKLSSLQSWSFVARWWWVGFMTNPRILREARLLWVKKLQVFYRPEVLTTSIGRNDSSEEAILETLFRHYLQHLLNLSTSDTNIDYHPAAGQDRGKIIHLRQEGSRSKDIPPVMVKAFTPAFYTEVVKSQTVSAAFENHCFTPAKGAKMVDVSDEAAFRILLQQTDSISNGNSTASSTKFVGDTTRRRSFPGTLLTYLFPRTKWNDYAKSLPVFDAFVYQSHPDQHRYYSKIVMRTLLADTIAFGFMPLLDIYIVSLWMSLGYIVVKSAIIVLEQQWTTTTWLQYAIALLLFHSSRSFLASSTSPS